MVSAVPLQDGQKPRTVLSSSCIWMPGVLPQLLVVMGQFCPSDPVLVTICLLQLLCLTLPFFEFIVILFNYVSVCISVIIFNYVYVRMPAGWYMHMRARPTKAEGVGSPWRRSYRLL